MYKLAEAFTESEIFTRFPDELLDITDAEVHNDLDEEDNYVDVYSYWIVSDRAWRTFLNLGEPVYRYKGLLIWGRTCTGQSVYMDYPVIEAAKINREAMHIKYTRLTKELS